MLNYDTLRDRPREFLAATGLTLEEWRELLPAFETAYENRYPPHLTVQGQERQRQAGGGAKGVLAKAEDKLLFILIYHKTNPRQTMHGLQFGLSQSQTNEWIHRLLPVLRQALRALGHLPERQAGEVAASHLSRESAPDAGPRRDGTSSPASHRGGPTKGALERQKEDAYGQEHSLGQRDNRQSRLSQSDGGG